MIDGSTQSHARSTRGCARGSAKSPHDKSVIRNGQCFEIPIGVSRSPFGAYSGLASLNGESLASAPGPHHFEQQQRLTRGLRPGRGDRLVRRVCPTPYVQRLNFYHGVDQIDVLLGNSATGHRESLLSFIGGALVAARWKQWRIYFTDVHPTGIGPQRQPGISAPMAGYPKIYNIGDGSARGPCRRRTVWLGVWACAQGRRRVLGGGEEISKSACAQHYTIW